MLTFPTNYVNFIGRLFFLVVTFLIEYILVKFGLKDPKGEQTVFQITAIHLEFKVINLLYLLIAIMGFLSFTIVSSLLSINKIRVDTSGNTITFVGPFNRQTIATIDIKEYFETVHTNAFKSWHGLLIKTCDNKTIQVAGQNIKSVLELKNYLDDRNIFYAGIRKMSFPFN
jgi:hypothetical protein